jgi:hypothetical protein
MLVSFALFPVSPLPASDQCCYTGFAPQPLLYVQHRRLIGHAVQQFRPRGFSPSPKVSLRCVRSTAAALSRTPYTPAQPHLKTLLPSRIPKADTTISSAAPMLPLSVKAMTAGRTTRIRLSQMSLASASRQLCLVRHMSRAILAPPKAKAVSIAGCTANYTVSKTPAAKSMTQKSLRFQISFIRITSSPYSSLGEKTMIVINP